MRTVTSAMRDSGVLAHCLWCGEPVYSTERGGICWALGGGYHLGECLEQVQATLREARETLRQRAAAAHPARPEVVQLGLDLEREGALV